MSKHGLITWNELNTWDPETAKAYYGAVFDWTFEELQTAGTDQPRPYYMIMKGDVSVGGIFTMIEPQFNGIPEHWFTYIGVDDVEEALRVSDAAGGTTIRAPFDIPNAGRLAIVRAKGGAHQGFFQTFANDDTCDHGS